MEIRHKWPDQNGSILTVDTIYYKFKTSGVDDGHLQAPLDGGGPSAYPTVSLQAEVAIKPQLNYLDDFRLLEFDDKFPSNLVREIDWDDVEVAENGDWDEDYRPDIQFRAPNLDGKLTNELKWYTFSIHRNYQGYFSTWLRYETTLTYFKPGKITCNLQYDDSGVGEDDHIRFLFTFDKPDGGASPPCENQCSYYQVFDEPNGNQKAGQDFLGDKPYRLSGYYVDSFYPNLFEDENGPDYRLLIHSYDETWTDEQQPKLDTSTLRSSWLWPSRGLPPLDTRKGQARGRFLISDAMDADDADYQYLLEYERRHFRKYKKEP